VINGMLLFVAMLRIESRLEKRSRADEKGRVGFAEPSTSFLRASPPCRNNGLKIICDCLKRFSRHPISVRWVESCPLSNHDSMRFRWCNISALFPTKATGICLTKTTQGSESQSHSVLGRRPGPTNAYHPGPSSGRECHDPGGWARGAITFAKLLGSIKRA